MRCCTLKRTSLNGIVFDFLIKQVFQHRLKFILGDDRSRERAQNNMHLLLIHEQEIFSRPSTQRVSRPFPSSKKKVQTTKLRQNLPDFPAIFVLMSQSKLECKEQNMDPEAVQQLVLFSAPHHPRPPGNTLLVAVKPQHSLQLSIC